ncbi:hypothetical protein LBMAG49_27740 [Planctomycetota bacterium]|nr:hypothetical protein LBMAG49_27740 [Planctomycetota bacterium]
MHGTTIEIAQRGNRSLPLEWTDNQVAIDALDSHGAKYGGVATWNSTESAEIYPFCKQVNCRRHAGQLNTPPKVCS